jgi:pimeloyl-ACP methyl ester carboxylesterase
MFDTLKKLKYGARVLLSRSGTEEIVEVSGRKIQMQHGGEGPPFVYLHSALGETIWLPFLERWAKEFEVFAPAHPGFAKSEGFERIDAIEDMAFHYIELFDALGLEKVNLGGVSLGAWIAAEFACRWPERVARLWLCCPPGLWIDGHPYFDLYRYSMDTEKLREALFHDPKSYQAEMILKNRSTLDDQTLMTIYQNSTVLARLVWERPYNPKLPERLHRIKCPTLVLHGESDRLVPPAHGRRYHELIPGSQLHSFKQCGHLPMFEKEAEFVDTITRFCRV